MSLKLFTVDSDNVIDGFVVSGVTDYGYALEQFVPLIGRLEIQRDALKTKFYTRLEADIVRGCVMPPITIALIHSFGDGEQDAKTIQAYIKDNLASAFVLDGIQRLNTLNRASHHQEFQKSRPIYVNFVIAGSQDRLLYRMITLNNGQKPMSARHQIDVLADAFFNFGDIDLKLVAEKGNGRVRAPESFKKADFVKGYVAYLSGSVNIDNQKIIEEKMDELIASKIIDSDITSSPTEFSDVVKLINKFSQSPTLREWIRNQNNFIGFCVGAKSAVNDLDATPINDIEHAIGVFEKSLSSINVSKVNFGKARRESVSNFIGGFSKLMELDEYELLDKISDWI